MTHLEFKERYREWALVTGASDGIGREMALGVAKRGLNVLIVARRLDRLNDLATEIRSRHRVECRVYTCDLAEPSSVGQLMEQCQQLNIGLFIAAAGFGTSGPFVNSNLKLELDMLQVNCGAVLALTHHFAKEFSKNRRGGIVLMGSLVGFQGVPFASNYAATKAYIQGLAEALYFELKPLGVDVISSAPGPVHSGFAKRAGMVMSQASTPKEVAEGTLNALSHQVTVRPGILSKFLGWSLILLPRGIRVRIMQKIMAEMSQSKRA